MNLRTQRQVFEMCQDVGFQIGQAKIASAIACCEAPGPSNGGEPTVDFDLIGDQELANTTWGYSYGGFQIRSLRAAKGTGAVRDEDILLKPRTNCRSALAIRRASGWEAWSTYKNGMHKAYLQEPFYPGDEQVFTPEPGTYIVVAGDTLSGIADKIGGFTWQDLARVNGISAPYPVYIGQTLTLPDAEALRAERESPTLLWFDE
jgi:nucleoid-associated protein YgaU